MSSTSCKNSASVLAARQTKLCQLSILKVSLLLVVLVFVGCQGQTFQYSRGWTNGKRSGGYPLGNPASGSGGQPPFDSDNGIVNVPSAEETSMSPGTLRMRSAGPQGRLRSLDYAQYLSKRLNNAGNAGGNRKPVWVLGVGVDQDSTNSNAEF